MLAGSKRPWGAEPDFADEEFRSVEAPTLLAVGDRDIVTPSTPPFPRRRSTNVPWNAAGRKGLTENPFDG